MANFIEYVGDEKNIQQFKNANYYSLHGGSIQSKLVFNEEELINYINDNHPISHIYYYTDNGELIKNANLELGYNELGEFSAYKIIIN